MFSADTYKQRRAELRKRIGNGLILIPGNTYSPNNYPNNAYYFRQDSTFLYYFGLNLPTLMAGDDILIMGETTGVVEQKAEGIVLNEQVVDGVKQGDVCSIKTVELVRRGDKLYKEVKR